MKGARRLPRLHVVSDDRVLAREGWTAAAIGALESGRSEVALHVRGPGTSAARLHALVVELLPHARRTGALLTVNDRVDVALATGLGSVHLRRRSLPVTEARRLMGANACVGLSCHVVADVAGAGPDGADYVFVGNVYETRSHPGRAGIGPAGLQAVITTARALPVFGIGGVDPPAVARVMEAGAYGVAVSSGVWDAAEPAAAVSEYLSSLSRTDGVGDTTKPSADRRERSES